jgi:hypothetical protein
MWWRWLVGLRKPEALCPSCLTSRLWASERASVCPVRMAASITGHRVSMVAARRMALRWCAAGLVEAGKQFRRVNGHLHLQL